MGKCSNAFFSETTNMNKAKTIQGTFLLCLVPIGPVVSEKNLAR
jgi:hypothetical protein